MPQTPFTRRAFMHRGLTMLSAGLTVPGFLGQTAWAMADPLDAKLTQAATGTDGRVLVVVQLSGGNDGLNTVVPVGDDAYHRARPAIGKRAGDVIRVNDYLGMNRSLEPLEQLFGDGLGQTVLGVGYPNPNRSHFRSMDVWHSADPDSEVVRDGWLGRYFDAQCAGADPAEADATVGIGVGDELPLAMQGQTVTPMTFERPEDYRYAGLAEREHLQMAEAARTGDRGDALDFLTRTTLDAKASSDRVLAAVGSFDGQGDYPAGEFGSGLRSVAAMIAANLPTRVYYVSLGGFDTHANQPGRHDRLLAEYARGVRAFWDDLRRLGHAERTLMMSFSEFGRRVAQNGSNGTDHGAAAPMFLFGPSVKPGVLGTHPSLTDLDNGDLKFTADFRAVYATVLQDWLKEDPTPILGGRDTLPLLQV